ncbi:MAG: response regulator [Anaerolineae bacterium]|nr:response regulator [Anaerolineae bacterium]
MNNRLALIIEDDKNVARLFADALQAVGFETEIVDNGNAALARLAEIAPVLVILDLNLPGIHGLEILSWIRAQERLVTTRVVVTTGLSLTPAELEDKADLVLIKPLTYEQLQRFTSRLAQNILGE